MTNGQRLRVRAAMKPISTLPRALATVDMATGDEAVAINQRSHVCAVPAAGGGGDDGCAGSRHHFYLDDHLPDLVGDVEEKNSS